MSIYAAIGGAFVIFHTCVGVYVIGRLAYEGLKRAVGRLEIGEETEDSAVRDFLAVKGQIR